MSLAGRRLQRSRSSAARRLPAGSRRSRRTGGGGRRRSSRSRRRLHARRGCPCLGPLWRSSPPARRSWSSGAGPRSTASAASADNVTPSPRPRRMASSRILPPLRMVSALLAVKARMSSQEARDGQELGPAPADRGLEGPILAWTVSRVPTGWTVFKAPSTPWVSTGRRIRSVRFRLGPTRPTRLKTIVLTCRALQPLVRWLKRSSDLLALPATSGQRWREHEQMCS